MEISAGHQLGKRRNPEVGITEKYLWVATRLSSVESEQQREILKKRDHRFLGDVFHEEARRAIASTGALRRLLSSPTFCQQFVVTTIVLSSCAEHVRNATSYKTVERAFAIALLSALVGQVFGMELRRRLNQIEPRGR